MKITIFLCLLVFAFSTPLVHADAPSDQQISQDTQQLKEDYRQKADQELKDLGMKIKRLKRRADKQVNKDLAKETKDLEAQKKAADKKLTELGTSTGDAWKDLRHGMDQALKDLKGSVDNAAAQFAPKPRPMVK